jgi:hypothetical protein
MHSNWMNRAASVPEVVAHVRSGMTVFLHGASARPSPLVEALAGRTDLERVRIVHLHTEGTASVVAPGKETAFRAVSLVYRAPPPAGGSRGPRRLCVRLARAVTMERNDRSPSKERAARHPIFHGNARNPAWQRGVALLWRRVVGLD